MTALMVEFLPWLRKNKKFYRNISTTKNRLTAEAFVEFSFTKKMFCRHYKIPPFIMSQSKRYYKSNSMSIYNINKHTKHLS